MQTQTFGVPMRFHSTLNKHTFPVPTIMKLKVLDGIQASLHLQQEFKWFAYYRVDFKALNGLEYKFQNTTYMPLN